MGRVKLRQHGVVKTTAKSSSSVKENTVLKNKVESKKGKKLDKKKNFLLRLETQKSRRGESSTSSMLSQLEATLKPVSDDKKDNIRPASLSTIKSNNMKKTVAIRESERLKLVQQHPQFIANPIEAVRMHINHMISMKTATNKMDFQ